jgi:hypothetical protein
VRSANLELRVEELVLRGFAPGDRYLIGEAVERELSRLFAARDATPHLVRAIETERLDGGAFDVPPGAGTEAIGVGIARAVYAGLAG